MGTPYETEDMLTLKEAAVVADRSEYTIRSWVREGLLERHEGPKREGGGSPPILVRYADLIGVLVEKGINPKAASKEDMEDEDEDEGELIELGSDNWKVESYDPTELMTLKEQLWQARVELERERGAKGAAEAKLEQMGFQVAQLQHSLASSQEDAKDWRERHDARETELKALRETMGRPGWRRLLTG